MYFATFYGPKCIYDVVANTFTAWHIAAYIQVMLKHPKCNFQMYRANVGLRRPTSEHETGPNYESEYPTPVSCMPQSSQWTIMMLYIPYTAGPCYPCNVVHWSVYFHSWDRVILNRRSLFCQGCKYCYVNMTSFHSTWSLWINVHCLSG